MKSPTELPIRSGMPFHEQRQWGRFLVDVGQIVIRIGDDDYRRAAVLDESFGGIGLALDGLLPVRVGDQVAMNYEGTSMAGVVQYAAAMHDGQQRVGIEWLDAQVVSSSPNAGLAQIEGRLVALFRLLEGGGWDELARAARQLRGEADALGFDELVAAADELILAVEDHGDRQSALHALETLVDACTAVAR